MYISVFDRLRKDKRRNSRSALRAIHTDVLILKSCPDYYRRLRSLKSSITFLLSHQQTLQLPLKVVVVVQKIPVSLRKITNKVVNLLCLSLITFGFIIYSSSSAGKRKTH